MLCFSNVSSRPCLVLHELPDIPILCTTKKCAACSANDGLYTQLQHAVEKAASEQRQGTPPAATSDQQRPSEAGSPGQHITNDKASPQTVPPADSAAYDCCSRDGARSRHEEPAPKRKDTAEKHIKAGQKSKEHEAAPDRGQHTPTREHGQTERYAKAIKNWWDERERGRAELRYG